MKRALAVLLGSALAACTLVRDLDYLTDGPATTDGGGGEGGAPPDAGGRTAEVMAGGLVVPRLLVQDEASLYWVTSDGSLFALKKENETTPRKLASLGPSVVALAADPATGGSLYFAAGAQVASVPKAGGTPAPLGSTSPPPAALAIDDANVFVMAYQENAVDPPAIVRIARTGGAKVQIAGAGPDTTDLFAIALDRDNVFWDEGDNVFRSAPKTAGPDAGAAMQYRASGSGTESAIGPRAFAVDQSAIYYSDGTAVRSLQRAASATPTTLITPTDDLAELDVLAIDDTHAYALDVRVNGALWRNVKTGRGTPEKLVSDLPKPNAIAVDATWIYVTVEGPEGKLLRVKK